MLLSLLGRIGRGQPVQVSVDTCREGVIDAFHLGDFGFASSFQAHQATEMLEQAGARRRGPMPGISSSLLVIRAFWRRPR